MTIMSQGDNDGERRCDARCYDAKGPDCDCVCGGANHGKGLTAAIQQNEERFLSKEARAALEELRSQRALQF